MKKIYVIFQRFIKKMKKNIKKVKKVIDNMFDILYS